MLHLTDDLRIEQIRPLIPPAILMENLPLTEGASTTVVRERTHRLPDRQKARTTGWLAVGRCFSQRASDW